MLKTMATVFPYTYLWKVPSALDLIAVGSNEPIEFTADEIIAKVEDLNILGYPIECTLSRKPDQIQDILMTSPLPLNTDDFPTIEFRVANNILLGDLAIADTGQNNPQQ